VIGDQLDSTLRQIVVPQIPQASQSKISIQNQSAVIFYHLQLSLSHRLIYKKQMVRRLVTRLL
jgi:hypothetical protein